MGVAASADPARGAAGKVANELFVDTSAWFALASPAERMHGAVADALRDALQRRRRIVTSNLVVAETHVLLMRRFNREVALAFVHEVGREPNVVVYSTSELEARARRDWLGRFSDQDFSFTDAVSFALMSDRRIRTALALDHHFAAAGFEMVPAVS